MCLMMCISPSDTTTNIWDMLMIFYISFAFAPVLICSCIFLVINGGQF